MFSRPLQVSGVALNKKIKRYQPVVYAAFKLILFSFQRRILCLYFAIQFLLFQPHFYPDEAEIYFESVVPEELACLLEEFDFVLKIWSKTRRTLQNLNGEFGIVVYTSLTFTVNLYKFASCFALCTYHRLPPGGGGPRAGVGLCKEPC